MPVWDTTTPLGSESKSQGDDRIREMKTAMQNALQAGVASGTEAVFPGSAPSTNPVFRYRGLKGTTGARPAAGEYGLYINETLNTLQRDNGSSWQDIATLIPSGTVMVFFQAAAPVGWTKLATQNDKALRVVSAAGGGSGGTHAVSSGLSHSHTVDSHTHTGPSHTHTGPSHTHTVPIDGYGNSNQTVSGRLVTGDGSLEPQATTSPSTGASGTGATGASGTGATGAASPGTDTQAPVIQYIDVIICSKD